MRRSHIRLPLFSTPSSIGSSTPSSTPFSIGASILVILLAGLLFVLLPAATAGAKKKDDDELTRKERKALREELPEEYRQWLEDVQYLISDQELDLFLQLEKNYLRDAFIEEFWDARDPYPDTGRNEFREDYKARLQMVRQSFEGEFDDRARVLLTNGYPTARVVVECRPYLDPIEVWYYDGSLTVSWEFFLLFYQNHGMGPYRLWDAAMDVDEIGGGISAAGSGRGGVTPDGIQTQCRHKEAEAVLTALSFTMREGAAGSMGLHGRIIGGAEAPPKQEWVATFNSYTTELPDDAELFDAALEVSYPGRKQSRAVVQGNLVVEKSNVEPMVLGDGLSGTYNLSLTGEILRGDELFDNFRYEYAFPEETLPEETLPEEALPEEDSPEAESATRLPLVFQRYLRPGEYTLMVKVEDQGSGRFHRSEKTIQVPNVDEPPEPVAVDPETARILEEANRAIRSGETTIQIPPLFGDWQTGLVRVGSVVTGPVDHVTFFLDGRPILTKREPPFNVELDLGDVPRPRVLRVEAFDEEGNELAADERMLNTGRHRFAVRLEEPRPGKSYARSLRAEADVVVPKDEALERVEFYMNETRVATLYQPPWTQPMVLPEGEALAYVRAVAYTPDGRSTEDTVFVNAPANFEYVDVDFVELYTLVLDDDGRPVEGLTKDDFKVLEDGVEQEVVRFEKVENLPIHAAILLDVSASMEDRLDAARDAALHFFEQAITPKDRATTITFNDHPKLTVDFTNDLERLASGLAGVQAERGTALYDSLIFGLYYFNGIDGQRAILLLSDGQDESSEFEFEEVLEYARRSGVSIYSVGLDLGDAPRSAKKALERLADETGGRSFFVDDAGALTSVYDTIQQELRSRYLLAYQSSNTSQRDRFRTIQVVMDDDDLEAKTMRGYYP